jgi:hypothetical protein
MVWAAHLGLQEGVLQEAPQVVAHHAVGLVVVDYVHGAVHGDDRPRGGAAVDAGQVRLHGLRV